MEHLSSVPGDDHGSLQQSKGSTMQRLGCCFILAGWLFTADSTAAIANDEIAIQYARDAVATLKQDYQRLHDVASSGAISVRDLQRREDDLRDAQLLLLRLEKDTNGITALLHDEVERREKHQLRVRKLAESGNISANQVADAEFCVLRARLSLARQTNDQELKNATLKAAIAIEEEKLRSMADAASKGHISIAAIAAQKLRIARIIAEEQIVAP